MDLLLLTVPDAALESVACGLAHQEHVPKVVVHFSGARDSQLLSPLALRGCSVASAHPLQSFADASHFYHPFFSLHSSLNT